MDVPESPMIPPRPLPSMIVPELRSPTMSFPVNADIRPIASATTRTAQIIDIISLVIKSLHSFLLLKTDPAEAPQGPH